MMVESRDEFALRVFRPVDETHEIAVVEVAEAMHLVRGRGGIREALHDLRRELEAQIHAPRPDMEQHVARRSDRVARPGVKFPKRMQLCRPRLTEEPIPGLGAKSHDARQSGFNVAEPNRAHQPGKIRAQRPQRRAILGARLDAHHQKNRGPAERRQYRLGDGGRSVWRFL